MADKKIALNITSAVAIGGKIITPASDAAKGLMVDEGLAKNLLQRGRAELATEEVSDKPTEDQIDATLAEMSAEQLRAEAKKRGIKDHAKKDVEALKAAIKAGAPG
jgi:hypothetical protein